MIIGTHDGRFHADEALACFLLKLLPKYNDATILRTRDSKVLEELDVVLDVGGVYDPTLKKFDHHQRGFNETFSSKFFTKLSSAGLIYKHFGKEVIKTLLPDVTEEQLDIFYEKIYVELIEEFDGIDNGISPYTNEANPKYKIGFTDVFSQVNHLNPSWNEPIADDQQNMMKQFEKAMNLTGSFFIQKLDYLYKSWWPAKCIIQQAFNDRFNTHVSGQILILKMSAPWKDHLFQLESDTKAQEQVKYIIYPDTTHHQWMIQAVPLHSNSFISRKALPEAWRGVRNAELDKISNISNCIFVHATGFIGGNQTLEGVLQMAIKSLE